MAQDDNIDPNDTTGFDDDLNMDDTREDTTGLDDDVLLDDERDSAI